MRNGLFVRLAVTNIRKNKSTYIPYMLTCIFDIAMFYMMLFINQNAGMDAIPHSGDVVTITGMGIGVIGIFSFIFLMYSNSFLMKRRQKELGLYNILGMEKSHISRMMFLETLFSSLISFTGGILLGILGSKLALLFLLKLIHVPAQFGFEVEPEAISLCAGFYGVVFFVILLNNLRRVQFAQPIELLRGGNAGEREPKAKWLMALIGFICLGSGYYIAITTESPLSALPMFFLAVLLVMAGTYLVFTAGSIVILKMMRWKKSFYYKTKNFTSVSGMIYRMKQNAVGLASICILSTGVLLMISTTVCLNSGVDDIMENRYCRDVMMDFKGITREEGEAIRAKMQEEMEKAGIPYENVQTGMELSVACAYDGSRAVFRQEESLMEAMDVGYLNIVPLSEYEMQVGESVSLSPGEVIAWKEAGEKNDSITVNDTVYSVKEWSDNLNYEETISVVGAGKNITIVVTDEDYEQLYEENKKVYGKYASELKLDYNVDISGSKEDEVKFGNQVTAIAGSLMESGIASEKAWLNWGTRQEGYSSFYTMFGGLFFLGIFLGALFLMGAAMIIYYKQVSEGYEDKERFEIMQKVGMSHKEVKSSIHRQIVMVFFAPLLVAGLHITMAFPMVKRLLLLFSMNNSALFAGCTAVTIGIFAVVYGIIYGLTAKSYYRIVERKS